MLRTVALGTVNAGATGTAIGVQDLQNSYVQLTGTFSATWYVDVSMNGTNYAVFDSGSAAKLVGPIPVAGTVRLRVGAGSGSVIGVLAGDDAAAGSVKITPLGEIDDGDTGDDYAVEDLAGCYVVVSGTFTGTWTVDFSTDGGTNYRTLDSNTTAKYVGPLPRCGIVRATLGSGSGTAVVHLAGICYEAGQRRNADPGRIREGICADITSQAYKALVPVSDLQSTQVFLSSADFVGTYDVQVTMNHGTAYVTHTTAVVSSNATSRLITLPRCTGFRVGASAYSSGTLATSWSGPADRLG